MAKKNEATAIKIAGPLEGEDLRVKVLNVFRAVVPRIADVEIDAKALEATIHLPATSVQEIPPTHAGTDVEHVTAILRANQRQRAIHRETGLTGEEDALLRFVCDGELVPVVGGPLTFKTIMVRT